MGTAFLGLGANLGDRLTALRSAVSELLDLLEPHRVVLEGVASLYDSAPVDVSSEQPWYLNSAICISGVPLPFELLELALSVEAKLGRVRLKRGEARVIDIDLLLFDDLVMHEPRLVVPHSRLQDRRFVLEPLCELAPTRLHPLLKRSMSQLAAELRTQFPEQIIRRVAGPEWFQKSMGSVVKTPLVNYRVHR